MAKPTNGTGVVIDHNLSFGNGSGDYNFINGGSDYSYTRGATISAAPLFLNSTLAGFDPHLGAGSPAVNAGLNLSSFFTTDKDGATRPASGAWDIGAYRYGNTDVIPPTVSLTAPANNATVSGSSVAVSANASDNVGVAGVQFKLDGANLGPEVTSAPYGVSMNTTTIANGSHTLSAVARDAAGNQATASSVSIIVDEPVVHPRLTLGRSQGGDLLLQWQTQLKTSYQLQKSSDLRTWIDVGAPIAGDASVRSVTNPISASTNSFFRLKLN